MSSSKYLFQEQNYEYSFLLNSQTVVFIWKLLVHGDLTIHIYSWKPYHACKSLCVCGGKYGENITSNGNIWKPRVYIIYLKLSLFYTYIILRVTASSIRHSPSIIIHQKYISHFLIKMNSKTWGKNPNKWVLQGAIAYRLSMNQLLQLTDRWAHERTQ